jgi:hypothetical protein
MDTQNLDLEAPSAAAPRQGRLRRTGERLVIWLHAEAQRRDLVPTEFGEREPVDETDAGALVREWMRQARLWADYNPEEMLALKAGAVGLGAALLVLVILISTIR